MLVLALVLALVRGHSHLASLRLERDADTSALEASLGYSLAGLALGDGRFLVYTADAACERRALRFARNYSHVHAASKGGARVRRALRGGRRARGDALRVLLHPAAEHVDPMAFARAGAALARAGAHRLEATYWRLELAELEARAAETLAESLATLDAVVALEYASPVYTTNAWARAAMTATGLDADDAGDGELPAVAGNGSGLIMAISDTGIALDSCYFRSATAAPRHESRACLNGACALAPDNDHPNVRVYWRGTGGDWADANGHGTHTAGTLAGLAAEPGEAARYNGLAPAGARLVVVDMQSAPAGPLLLPEPIDTHLLAVTAAYGATTHSMSWGARDGAYSELARRVDVYLWAHDEYVAVIAADNAGEDGVSSPALAKNALAVGAMMSGATAAERAGALQAPRAAYGREWLASFSSRGSGVVPWFKPDVCASGAPVRSASSRTASCAVATLAVYEGTSQATPSVAAAVARVQAYCLGGGYAASAFMPRASLVRALMALATRPGAGVFPLQPMATVLARGRYGRYGRLNVEGRGRLVIGDVLVTAADADASLLLLSSGERPFVAGARAGAGGNLHRYCVAVTSSSAAIEVRVALAWSDPPTAPGAPGALVNDLDLEVHTLSGTAYRSTTSLPVNGLDGRDSDATWEAASTRLVALAADRTGLEVSVRLARHGYTLAPQRYSLALLARSADGTPVVLTQAGRRPRSHTDVDVGYDAAMPCAVCDAGAVAAHLCAGRVPEPPTDTLPPPPLVDPLPPAPTATASRRAHATGVGALALLVATKFGAHA